MLLDSLVVRAAYELTMAHHSPDDAPLGAAATAASGGTEQPRVSAMTHQKREESWFVAAAGGGLFERLVVVAARIIAAYPRAALVFHPTAHTAEPYGPALCRHHKAGYGLRVTPRSRAVALFCILGQCNAATRASLGDQLGAPFASVVVRAVVDISIGILRAHVDGDAVAPAACMTTAATGTALHGCVVQ